MRDKPRLPAAARWYLAAVTVSSFGSTAMQLVGGAWMKVLTGSSARAGQVDLFLWLAVPAGPLLGAVVDRFRRVPVLVAGHLGCAVLGLSLLLLRGPRLAWLLCVVLAGYGLLGMLIDAAESAFMVRMVGSERLGTANGLRMALQEGCKLLAPALGAALFAWRGGRPVALLDALSFLVPVLVLLALRLPPEPRPARVRGVGLLAGLRHVFRPGGPAAPLLGGAAAVMFAGCVASSVTFAVLQQALHRSPAFVGVLAPAQGVGSLLGGLLVGRLDERLAVACGALGVAAGALAFTTGSLPVTLGGAVLRGAGLVGAVVGAATAALRDAPERMQGLVGALVTTVVFGPNAVAIGLGSGLLPVAGFRPLLLAAAGLGLVTAGWLARRLRRGQAAAG